MDLIPEGDVDERSIIDVDHRELVRYTQCHFFAGIGGWPLALRTAGWPDDRPVYSGSCPCQPFSTAGKKRSAEDARHLWPQFFRIIEKCRPSTCFGEQVASSLGRTWLAGVRADLEVLGYEVGAADLCAACLGAPHIRQRLFWVALPGGNFGLEDPKQPGVGDNPGKAGDEGREALVAGAESIRQGHEQIVRNGVGATDTVCGVGDPELRRPEQRHAEERTDPQFDARCLDVWRDSVWHKCIDGKYRRIPTESLLQRMDDGVPEGLDLRGSESGYPLAPKIKGRVAVLRGYGNAIVPQVGAVFIKTVMEIMSGDKYEK